MKVGITACSDGQLKEREKQNEDLGTILYEQGIETVFAKHIYAEKDSFSGTDKERAEDLMRFYQDDSIAAIYDISGGDLANGVLRYLDWDVIAAANKTFWGYSDLTTVINAIYTKTGKSSVLFQIKNLVYANGKLQRKRFAEFISKKNNKLFDVNYSFLQGERMEGIVVGGNIRCLLKLAGTEYWPNMNGKLLFLEAYGGEVSQIAALFIQLEQMGVFKQLEGIILGTFTAYEKSGATQSVFDLLAGHIPETLPVAKTTEIGHGTDSKAIVIGCNMELRN
ncbi:Muramoyltetrapeptide carboxypeptidase LdcA (peptidoglycan recycling) [Lachnospiraceae bacterium KH1T2]|nr:Muramoyltetrapeptide carboxypeptidase LdcA (peptidoglycan recycling) [Lachnospiraceae bacterium KH1T2]